MSDQPHSDQVWDRFFTLLYPCDETVTDEEVDADLNRLRIDMVPAFSRLRNMVLAHRAKEKLSTAKETRQALAGKIQDIFAPKLNDIREGIKKLIDRAFAGQEQLAYFHKLESAASEDDLRSLLDDLERLTTLRKLGDGHDTASSK